MSIGRATRAIRGRSEPTPSPGSTCAPPGPACRPRVPSPAREVRQRSELEIRWRQARNAPPPVVRAVLANVAVAVVGGIVLLLIDWLASHGVLPAGWTSVAPLVYVVVVIVSGSVLTYLWVELPTGGAGERRRSRWAAVLGFFASIPIVYLALVVIFEVLRPLLGASRPVLRLGVGPTSASIAARRMPPLRRGSSSTVRAVGLYPTGSWFESRLPYQSARAPPMATAASSPASSSGRAKAACRPCRVGARGPCAGDQRLPDGGRPPLAVVLSAAYWQLGEVPASTGANW